MQERILIFGNGQVGNFYKKYFNSKNIEAKIAKCDVTNKRQLEIAFDDYKPQIVINTAGKTNLEWCDKNRLETFNVNVLGADNLADLCDKNDIYLMHFSSGCIFESMSSTDYKKEGDIPNPSAYYAWTKVWAEQIISFKRSNDFRYLILRPRQPVSTQVNYKNMLIKLLTFVKFVDTPNAGTVLEDLMEWTERLIEIKPVGVLHVANEGWTTPYEIGLLLKKHVLPNLDVNMISKNELDKITPNRRVDTLLDVNKLKGFGIEVEHYQERLEEIIKKLGENIKNINKEELREQLERTIKQSKSRTVVNEVWKDLLR